MFYMQSNFNIPLQKRNILYMALVGSYRKTLKIIIKLLLYFVFPSCFPHKLRHIWSCEAEGGREVSTGDIQGWGHPLQTHEVGN